MEPFLPGIVDAIYQAFSIAVASTFALGIVAAAVAAGLVLLLKEAPATASVPATRPTAGAPTPDPTGVTEDLTSEGCSVTIAGIRVRFRRERPRCTRGNRHG